MFERYTEKARRVVFFARYEASSLGSPYIETEHLLLGLLRESKALFLRVSRDFSAEDVRKQIEENTFLREKVSTSVDLPLSNESKRILAYAAEEAERLGHKHIGVEHLLLGTLREDECFAAQILKERGFRLFEVRELFRGESARPELARERRVEAIGTQGYIEFVGSDGRRLAVAGISRTAPVPRVGEWVTLEIAEGEGRFQVVQVEYKYRADPPGSPHAANLLAKIQVHVARVSEAGERERWSTST